MKYSVRRVGDRWHVAAPDGHTVLDTTRWGAAVWLADNFATRAYVRDGMRHFGEESHAALARSASLT